MIRFDSALDTYTLDTTLVAIFLLSAISCNYRGPPPPPVVVVINFQFMFLFVSAVIEPYNTTLAIDKEVMNE